MVVFNPLKREIDIKIVYYGPALCGKTTNIQSVHKILNPAQRGELVSLATKDDRTLFFDFLPIELDSIKGFKTRFHIYTVPGQVLYNLTRRAVLTGVDGIIFVADSQADKMEENIASMNDLKENLKYYNKDLESVPFVIQYNKRDLDVILPSEEMESELNMLQVPSFIASAINDEGVMETLTMCCRMVLRQIKGKSRAKKATEIKEKDKERDKQKVEKAISELPELTLVKPRESEEAFGDTQQSPQEKQLAQVIRSTDQLEGVVEAGLRAEETDEQVEKEKSEVSVSQEMDQEAPHPEEHEKEPMVAKDLLEKEGSVQLGEPVSLVNEVQGGFQDEALESDHEVEVESPISEVSIPEEEGVESPRDSFPDETAKAGISETEDGKRTCPRCSLEFKSNVKQCPICKIALVPEVQEEKIGKKEIEVHPDKTITSSEPALAEEVLETFKLTDLSQDKKGLEIVACGHPRKVSPTAIRVPLIMKINETDQEFKVNLAIDFEDFDLKSKE